MSHALGIQKCCLITCLQWSKLLTWSKARGPEVTEDILVEIQRTLTLSRTAAEARCAEKLSGNFIGSGEIAETTALLSPMTIFADIYPHRAELEAIILQDHL